MEEVRRLFADVRESSLNESRRGVWRDFGVEESEGLEDDIRRCRLNVHGASRL